MDSISSCTGRKARVLPDASGERVVQGPLGYQKRTSSSAASVQPLESAKIPSSSSSISFMAQVSDMESGESNGMGKRRCCTITGVILAVCLVGIIVGAVFLVRALDKKDKGEGGGERDSRGAVPGISSSAQFDDALSKGLLFLETQRSGKLPPTNRIPWRGDSALMDGSDVGRDLAGGYYDAGDNIKFNLPMSYTITMMAWGVLEFGKGGADGGFFGKEYKNTLEAIKWGTDYLLKCWDPTRSVLYVGVGNAHFDHKCWQRPETTTIPRPSLWINTTAPGSDVAGGTAAALIASSLLFRESDPVYANQLLKAGHEICVFATQYKGLYSTSVPSVADFYKSLDYQDYITWCNAWLLRAYEGTPQHAQFLQFLVADAVDNWESLQCSWDDIQFASHVLLAIEAKRNKYSGLEKYPTLVEKVLCHYAKNMSARTKGGFVYIQEWAPIQYVASASLCGLIYADEMMNGTTSRQCSLTKKDVVSFAVGQAEYVLGKNPLKMSYMIGYSDSYPKSSHHRGSSIAVPGTWSLSQTAYTDCAEGINTFLESKLDNPNLLTGGIVGGPDRLDRFNGSRWNYLQNEPCLYVAGVYIPVFARLSKAVATDANKPT